VKIVVCVKQIAVLGDEIEFTAGERDVDPDYLDHALNEWDGYAVEEALRIRERESEGEVVVVSVGDKDVEPALRRALAMGADRALRVWSEDLAAIDPISVAQALADAARPEKADLVFAGVQSSDSVQAATGTALAEFLGLPRVAVVTKIEYDHDGKRATVHRELEGGLIDVVDVETPALLTIQTGINEPRYATLRAIKQAEQQEIVVLDPEVSGEQAAYRIRRMFVPPKGEGAELLDGGAAEIAQRIADIVRERLSG
jgi:electron transfer flavoprotein beta subunit